MKFKDVLNTYICSLSNLKQRYHRALISKEYFEGAIDFNFCWFQECKTECEEKCYKLENDVLHYRGHIYPIQTDEEGQQIYITLENGKEIVGGSFNFDPYLYFTREIDSYFQEEFLNSKMGNILL